MTRYTLRDANPTGKRAVADDQAKCTLVGNRGAVGSREKPIVESEDGPPLQPTPCLLLRIRLRRTPLSDGLDS